MEKKRFNLAHLKELNAVSTSVAIKKCFQEDEITLETDETNVMI